MLIVDRSRRTTSLRGGFTLVEAMVSTAITVVTGSAILLGIASSVRTTNDVLDQAQATGIAAQLMDEAVGRVYCQDTSNPYQTPLGPGASEAAGVCRERFNDIDDYAGFSCQPPKDIWGNLLGTDNGQGGQRDPNFRLSTVDFTNWTTSINVYYVSPTNLSQALTGSSTSDYRAVEVKVTATEPTRGTRPLVVLRRVLSYVPVQ